MSDYTLENKIALKLPITSITPFTFQDFPEKTACILWFSGCNFACGYCHNPELVRGSLKALPFERIDSFLKLRMGLLDGVVLCGGECTISPSLPAFIRYLNGLGFLVKLDTNGSNPAVLKRLIQKNLIDYVALDYKAPLSKFQQVTGYKKPQIFFESLQLLRAADIPVEVRTTVHTDLLDENDINDIIDHLTLLEFKGLYCIQNFRDGPTLGLLASQRRILDIDKIKKTTKFRILFRNF